MFRKKQTLILLFSVLMVVVGACRKKKNEPKPVVLQPVLTDFAPKLGKRGSTIILTGENFGDDISVKINGVPVSVNQKSSTQVVITVPNDETVIGGKLTVTTKGETLESTEEFEVTDVWVKLASVDNLPGRYEGRITFMYKDKIYWGFGDRGSGDVTNEMWSYDVKTYTSTQIATYNASAADRPSPRKNAACVVYHDKVYLFGGKNGTTGYIDVWEFDPNNNTWKKKNSISFQQYAFVYNDKIYLYQYSGANISSIYSYDPVADTNMEYWTNLPGRQYFQPVVNDNKVYFVGGRDFSGAMLDKRILVLDISAKVVSNIDIPDLLTNDVSAEHFAVTNGKKIFFGGGKVGWNQSYTDNCYSLDLETNVLSSLGKTPDDPFIAPFGTIDGKLYILCKTGCYKYIPNP